MTPPANPLFVQEPATGFGKPEAEGSYKLPTPLVVESEFQRPWMTAEAISWTDLGFAALVHVSNLNVFFDWVRLWEYTLHACVPLYTLEVGYRPELSQCSNVFLLSLAGADPDYTSIILAITYETLREFPV